MPSGTGVSVTLKVPATGFIYLNIHLDYGLKGTSGYSANSKGDAVDSMGVIVIPNRGSYTFSTSFGLESASDTICSINDLKKLPGVGGFAGKSFTAPDGNAGWKPNVGYKAVLKDSAGAIIATGVTDADGWYFCDYKWTGKPTTVFVTLTPPVGRPTIRSATLKTNGYAQIDFGAP